ncbi:MAG: PIN domain-containing protein, partial [Glaciimonas sp.]|nr:PIN domain-containing protein [Glaciimonas sp.]
MIVANINTHAFIDSNVVLYLLSDDAKKANLAEKIINTGSIISVQVLNECTNVMRRKLSMSWEECKDVITSLQSLCSVEPLTVTTHERGRIIAERYGLSLYDSM